MKTVLMIAYYFPPDSGSGTYRTLKFVKYLPLYGWKPIILTIKEEYFLPTQSKDYALSNKIPKEAHIVRTRIFRPHQFLINIKYSIKKFQKNKNRLEENVDQTKNQHRINQSLMTKLKDKITNLLSTPDQQIGWLFFAVYAGLMAIKRQKIDLIYSTGSPWTDHLIGYCLKKMTGLPWVADFRDPWTQNPYPWRVNVGNFLRSLEYFMERCVVKKADKVIANTEPLRQDFRKRYKSVNSDKFLTITNGYDPEDFIGLGHGPKKKEDIFTITHLGALYSKRNPEKFLMAIGELISRGKIDKKRVKVNLVGNLSIEGLNPVRLLRTLEIEENVDLILPVPHNVGLQYLINSDVLLLIQPEARLQLPGKLFEYIKLDKPILALTSKGVTAEVIRSDRLGVVADPDDVNAIQTEVYHLYLKFIASKLETNTGAAVKEKYNVKMLTGRLAAIFDKISYGARH